MQRRIALNRSRRKQTQVHAKRGARVRPRPHGRPLTGHAPSPSTVAPSARMRAWVSAGPSGGSSCPWHPFWPGSRLPGSRASPQKARSARYPRALQVVATSCAALGGSHEAVLPRPTVSTGWLYRQPRALRPTRVRAARQSPGLRSPLQWTDALLRRALHGCQRRACDAPADGSTEGWQSDNLQGFDQLPPVGQYSTN